MSEKIVYPLIAGKCADCKHKKPCNLEDKENNEYWVCKKYLYYRMFYTPCKKVVWCEDYLSETDNIAKQYDLSDFNVEKTTDRLGNILVDTYKWTDKEGNPVASFKIWEWWDGLNISDLRVYEKYRGKGLSYCLLDYATKVCGVKNLSVEKGNVIAKHIYDKYGFRTTFEDEIHYYMSIDEDGAKAKMCEKLKELDSEKLYSEAMLVIEDIIKCKEKNRLSTKQVVNKLYIEISQLYNNAIKKEYK